MKSIIINNILLEMKSSLDTYQLETLRSVIEKNLFDCEIIKKSLDDKDSNTDKLINDFISSKKVEGCSIKTLDYYSNTIKAMQKTINKDIKLIDTEDLRKYLIDCQGANSIKKVTVDNIRRILSSFFSWLEDEDIILKSPVRRIHKVKIDKNIKTTYSDEELEKMRDNAPCIRDIALIDILSSTGMRVGELVLLNRNDIDYNERECIVFGKGNKERVVYFDARTKIHLKQYIESRVDDNEALFVSIKAPYERVTIAGIEARLRKMGKKILNTRVHPHKFRRTLATNAIDKGMPIEQVQKLLGHQRIDTTLQYAMVKQNNVKISHKKYIG